MDSVLRGLFVYVFLLIVFRLSGKRTLAQMSHFDLVLLLIISETTQQAMIDNDHSVTNGVILILTLVGADIGLSYIKTKAPFLERWVESVPMVIVDRGKLLTERMAKARLDEDDILAAARKQQGIESLEGIEYAVLEKSGDISIIPRR